MFGQSIMAIVIGVGLHQTEPLIEKLNTDSETLKLMSRYSVGVLGNIPTFDLFMRLLGLDKKTRLMALIAYVLSFVFVGIGVFLGRVPRNLNGTSQQP